MTMNVPGTASQRCQAQNVSRPLRPFLFRGPLGQSRGMLLCRLPPGTGGKAPCVGTVPHTMEPVPKRETSQSTHHNRGTETCQR